MSEKNWKIKDEKIERGLEELGLSPLLCRLLANRGIKDKKSAEEFLNPKKNDFISPFEYLDMKCAIERVDFAIKNKEKILVWGDFDADGVTSTSILYKVLRKLNANFLTFIPSRQDLGHGLNSSKLIKFISREKIKLVITVDCGISNIKEGELLKSFKVDLIITDHHRAGDILPCACAIICASAKDKVSENIKIKDIESLSNLCGAGVAYKFMMALKTMYPQISDIEDELLSLACVGTISDVVPILGENRTIVAKGLELINEGKMPSITRLFEKCARKGEITSYDIAFCLTPRINALGRLADSQTSFEFLTEEKEEAFDSYIDILNNYNGIRQSMCEDMVLSLTDSVKKDKNPVIVMFNPNWHIGLIGLVASCVVELTHKPVFLMTKGKDYEIRCSVRSPKGYSVYEILEKLKENFLGFGGHKGAGGFSFDSNIISFDDIKKQIISVFKELYGDKKADLTVDVDMELEADDIDLELIDTIKKLEPYGEGNTPPVFCIKDVDYVSHKFVGKEANHLKLECKKDEAFLHCVFWGKSKFDVSSKFDILFYPKINEFNGNVSVQLELSDISGLSVQDEVKIYDHRKKTNIMSQINEYLKKDGINIFVWAKKRKTLSEIQKYDHIFKKAFEKTSRDFGIMFFDYPVSFEEFKKILNDFKPLRVHLLREDFDENIENYIKDIFGMLKFADHKKQGEIDTEKMAEMLGVSSDFIAVALEIFEKEGAIKILSDKKIEFIKAVNFDNFKNNTMFEVLNDEFENILNFKNSIMSADLADIKSLV